MPGWTASQTASGSWACNCIGPQNGDPGCPCQMRNVSVKDGRYVKTTDLGPQRWEPPIVPLIDQIIIDEQFPDAREKRIERLEEELSQLKAKRDT